MHKLRVLDLFSGIGGFSLGLERTGGFETVAFCEIDPFCRQVLAKHWPGVPIIDDVRTDTFPDAEVIVGGFPCQDVSRAGKRAGITGERSGLYRELVRAIRMVRPKYAIVENVAALLSDGMGDVLGALAEIGYDTEYDCVPAGMLGAPHWRDRVWILAYASGTRYWIGRASYEAPGPARPSVRRGLLRRHPYRRGRRAAAGWQCVATTRLGLCRGPAGVGSVDGWGVMTVRVIHGDCREVLRTLPDQSVHCVVTSPPYYGLRDYGVDGQMGLEETPEQFIVEMVEVFREVRRVLRDDGTLWLNIGDSYSSTHSGVFGSRASSTLTGGGGRYRAGSKLEYLHDTQSPRKRDSNGDGVKPKDLIGIPWMLAFALRADGWYLRSEIIWHKPNPMPESVTDRPTKAHEQVFLFSKAPRYFYDAEAISEPNSNPDLKEAIKHWKERPGNGEWESGTGGRMGSIKSGRNARSVWTIATKPYPEAHFATFPPDLPERCIKAGTSERGCCAACGAPWVRIVDKSVSLESGSGRAGNKPSGKGAGGIQTESGSYDIRMGPVVQSVTVGWEPSCQCDAPTIPCTVLDPFGCAGTTGLVADRLQRHAILIELNPQYAEMARRRVAGDASLFAEVAE